MSATVADDSTSSRLAKTRRPLAQRARGEPPAASRGTIVGGWRKRCAVLCVCPTLRYAATLRRFYMVSLSTSEQL